MKIHSAMTGPLSVNTYLVYDEETKKGILVDPGGYSAAISKQIKEEDISLEYILLTHGHGDHIGGVQDFKNEFPNAKIVAGKEELEMLSDGKLNSSLYIYGTNITITPDITVEDNDQLAVGNMMLRFLHTPGHSPGGICILIGQVLFSGDTLFQQSIGRTDLPKGSFPQLKKSIHEKLFTLPDDTYVLPGHMGETQIGFEKGNNPFV